MIVFWLLVIINYPVLDCVLEFHIECPMVGPELNCLRKLERYND